MDADVMAKAEQLLADVDAEDLVTLHGVAELVEKRITEAQFEMMMEWRSLGWQPNAPGLRCELCGGRTWGKDEGAHELVKCIDVMCGHLKYVVVR